jgi:uncharacterized protein Usg
VTTVPKYAKIVLRNVINMVWTIVNNVQKYVENVQKYVKKWQENMEGTYSILKFSELHGFISAWSRKVGGFILTKGIYHILVIRCIEENYDS